MADVLKNLVVPQKLAQIIEHTNAITTACNTNATATVCNSALGTLVLRKQYLRYMGKEWNYHPIQTQSHHHVGKFLPT